MAAVPRSGRRGGAGSGSPAATLDEHECSSRKRKRGGLSFRHAIIQTETVRRAGPWLFGRSGPGGLERARTACKAVGARSCRVCQRGGAAPPFAKYSCTHPWGHRGDCGQHRDAQEAAPRKRCVDQVAQGGANSSGQGQGQGALRQHGERMALQENSIPKLTLADTRFHRLACRFRPLSAIAHLRHFT